MTELLDRAVQAVKRQPRAVQDHVARAMLSLVEADAPEPPDSLHADAIAEGLAELRRGDHASDAEVEAAFRRFDE